MPGERTVYHEGYYAAFVLDPDGNPVTLIADPARAAQRLRESIRARHA